MGDWVEDRDTERIARDFWHQTLAFPVSFRDKGRFSTSWTPIPSQELVEEYFVKVHLREDLSCVVIPVPRL